jgi:acetyltransferase
MSIRHLDAFFEPRSVAVFGASERPASVGATVWRNLRESGFAGARWAVNPKHSTLGGEPAFADVASLPAAPELALICTPANTVVPLIEALGARGTHAAIVLTAGLTAQQKQAMLDAARKSLLRVLGPNCLGLISTRAGLNASFAHAQAQPGKLAFVSQSGAVVTAMLDWANARGIGFSHLVSLGEHADVDFGDLLDWLGSDADTRAVLLYVESIEAARKFMSAARATARNKPVLVVKAGRSPQGQQAAASHTGALASSDRVYDAAIRRAGMLRVDSLQDLFIAAETLSHFRAVSAAQLSGVPGCLTLFTNGGGAGVMAADAAAQAGIPLATLSDLTRRQLSAVLPPNWSHGNPVDIIGDAPVERYQQALKILLAERSTGTLLFMHAPTAIVPSAEIATALLPLLQEAPGRVLSCWLGGQAVQAARQQFQAAGQPSYETPEDAVRALSQVLTYRQNQALLIETPPTQTTPVAIDLPRVRGLVDQVLASGREWLDEPEAKALLAACGVPVVPVQTVGPDAQAAVEAARALGHPVVLKILSPQITHKSDVGGVALNLDSDAAVFASAEAMLKRVHAARPDAVISGFTVQPMVRRPTALELIVGTSVDPVFGPVLLFGQGGTAVEVLADRALALPPLNEPLALALIARTRVAQLLAGWRDVPAADLHAVTQVLMSLSALLAEEARIAEIDINPLLADASGVIALDARVRVSRAAPAGAHHFAIRPYPAELVEQLAWRGRQLTLRPIKPNDEAQHLAFLQAMDPEDIRLRVFYSRRSIEHAELARLTQIDYEREMAFIACTVNADGQEETLGVVRATCDPDNDTAEFGILVRSDLKGQGLGHLLMKKLTTHLRTRGTQRLVATMLNENTGMWSLAQHFGFTQDAQQPEPGVRSISLRL